MCDQCLCRHAAIDRPRRCFRHDDGLLATPTGITRAASDANPQLRRHDIELFGAQLTDAVHRATTAGTSLRCGIDHHLIARQVGGQRPMVAGSALGTRLGWRHIGRVLPGLVLGDRLLQVLEAELQLLVGQLLRAVAELVAGQALDQQAELVILGMQFGLLMQYRPQHLLEQVGVIREGVRVDLHRCMMNEVAASEPAFMAAQAMELPSELGPARTRRSTLFATVKERRQLRGRYLFGRTRE